MSERGSTSARAYLLPLALVSCAILWVQTSVALEGAKPSLRFQEMQVGEKAGATIMDFCGFDQRINLILDRPITPPAQAEVLVVRETAGIRAEVIVDDSVDSTRSAVFAMDPLLMRSGSLCPPTAVIWPVSAVGVEGLSVLRDETGNINFHFEGDSQ